MGLPATAVQRKASAASRNRPVAVFGRCERCHGKNKWGLGTIGPCTSLELQFSLVPQAHPKRGGRNCSIPVRIRFDWLDNLKQLVLLCVVLERTMKHGGSPTQMHDILGVFDPWFVEGHFGSDRLLTSHLRTGVTEGRSGNRRRLRRAQKKMTSTRS